ncbi:MauE/DoxX family redox-associated membrane protein [Actinomadura macrotermitis]|uniref:Methylamine utilisation protein MauE domain-containing protein n=1 Tax=Actinomadura macrotermitis TaxID=2585200 RepID=A0A7K0BMF7_9ACTN|nr:hypothetical protein [Actinomadura macrotermitis]
MVTEQARQDSGPGTPGSAGSTLPWIVAAAALGLAVMLAWTAWAKVDQEWIGVAGGLGIVAVLLYAARARLDAPWITLAARVGLAVVLGWAGLVKFGQAAEVQKVAVKGYQVMPDGAASIVATALPILEIVLAVLLLAGFATRVIAILSGLLMAVFIVGIAQAWARGLKIDCGCFGGGGKAADPQYLGEILRDTGFLALAAWTAMRPPGRFAVDRLLGLHED